MRSMRSCFARMDAMNVICLLFVDPPFRGNKPFLSKLRRTRLRPVRFALTVVAAMVATLPFIRGWAQAGNDSTTGFPEHGLFHGSGIESVQLNNGNSHIEIPLVHVPGRGGT